ncbi:MAG TPA: hypothetical protein VGM90_03025 [Kofleriaceae bacterium]|jgi:hypothetical protein
MKSACLLVVALLGCKAKLADPPTSGSGSAPAAVKSVDAAAPVAPPAPKDFELDSEAGLFKTHIKFTLRSDLVVEGSNARFKEPGEYGPTTGYIQFTPTCGGGCTDKEMTQALADTIKRAPEHAAQPNLNTGDPKLDAERLDVKMIGTGELDAGGKYVEYSVAKPPGVTGPYPVGYYALCIKWAPTKEYYVTAQVFADEAHQSDLRAPLIAACKGFTIVMPPGTGSGAK